MVAAGAANALAYQAQSRQQLCIPSARTQEAVTLTKEVITLYVTGQPDNVVDGWFACNFMFTFVPQHMAN